MPDDSLDPRLMAVLKEAQAVPPLGKAAIAARIGATLERRSSARHKSARVRGVLGRSLVAAAAALATFVGGVEYGRHRVPIGSSEAASGDQEPTVALAIQDAGSRYVARLAEFAARAPDLPATERNQAREVAIALLQAATLQILAQEEDDELLHTIARLAYAKRQAIRHPTTPDAVWF